jgi:hypothetical protein
VHARSRHRVLVAGSAGAPAHPCRVRGEFSTGGSSPGTTRGFVLVPHDDMVQTLPPDRADHALNEWIGVSRQLHRRRAVRRKPFELPIPSIRYMGASSN